MTRQAKRRSGQPMVAFLALLLGWTAIRMAVWESPFPRFGSLEVAMRNPKTADGVGNSSAAAAAATARGDQEIWSFAANGLIAPLKTVTADPLPFALIRTDDSAILQPEVIASHELLFLAAMGQVPVPAEVAQGMRERPATADARALSSDADLAKTAKRWSMDGWLFLRPDATIGANTGPRFASYGASQAGAVLRYRLKPSSGTRPAAYVRATRALAAGRESEVAAGLSARPIPGVPIAAYVELRATRGAVTSEVRPAAFAVTEFPPLDLPFGLRAETYVAAGYVGGDFATPFVDGQARIDREIIRFDLGSVRAGAGVWGGAQTAAARLDIGPSASVDVKMGPIPARLAVDYRLRAAGDAEPGSGAAITLTTGF